MTLTVLFNQQQETEEPSQGRQGFIPAFVPFQKTQRRLVFHKEYPVFVASRLKERKSIAVNITKRLLIHGSVAVHVLSKLRISKRFRITPLVTLYEISKILKVYDAFEESEMKKNASD